MLQRVHIKMSLRGINCSRQYLNRPRAFLVDKELREDLCGYLEVELILGFSQYLGVVGTTKSKSRPVSNSSPLSYMRFEV